MKKFFNLFTSERNWTILLSAIGVIAMLILLALENWHLSAILDAAVNFAQIGVVVVMFILTVRIFKPKRKKVDFYSLLEEKLVQWAADNKYLIDAKDFTITSSTPTDKKRVMNILCDLSRFADEEAEDSSHIKGAFIYFPQKQEFNKTRLMQFKINKTLFKMKLGNDYDNQRDFIAGKIADKIALVFKDLNIKTKRSGEPEKIDLVLKDLPETEENAERVIAIVEFVKTMVLALS